MMTSKHEVSKCINERILSTQLKCKKSVIEPEKLLKVLSCIGEWVIINNHLMYSRWEEGMKMMIMSMEGISECMKCLSYLSIV